MRISILIIVTMLFLVSCKNIEPLSAETQAQAQQMHEKITQQQLSIAATWAYPQANSTLNQLAINSGLGSGNTSTRISLAGNGDFLKIHKDSVSAYLPYYGERRISGGYNTESGIKFDGVPREYTVVYNEQKGRSEINFSISQGTESFQLYIDVYPNGNAQFSVSSSHRTNIRFDGALRPFVE